MESKQSPAVVELTDPPIEAQKQSWWKRFKVKANELIAEGVPMLMANGITLLSRGNLATVVGKPKGGKTFLISAIAAALLIGEYLGITCKVKNAKLLLVDSEQGRARTQKVLHRIYKMCGFDYEDGSENLAVVSVRELSPRDRLKVIQEAIQEFKPDLVLIDGVRDLLTNFNDVEESCELVNELMKLSEVHNCGIVTVIHQNKADTNARGHLGSELMNKSETVLDLKRDNKGVALVSPMFCRNPEFEEFSFRINAEGLPELCANTPRSEDPVAEVRSLITQAMYGESTMSKKELVANIAEITNMSDKTAERRIDSALKNSILRLNQDKIYSLLPEDETIN